MSEVLEVKRRTINGKYYSVAKVRTDDGRTVRRRKPWHPPAKDDPRAPEERYDYRPRKARAPAREPENEVTGYSTAIKLGVVVTYKGRTPMHYPLRGGTSTYYRGVRASEDSMLRALLGTEGAEMYEELQHWIRRWKREKAVRIYGGWTYQVYAKMRTGRDRFVEGKVRRWDGRYYAES